MKTGPGGWFVQTGCFVCHSISALGVKSPAQIGPDLSTAVEDVQSRFGVTLDDVPRQSDRHDERGAVAPDHPDAGTETDRHSETSRGVRGIPAPARAATSDSGKPERQEAIT